MPVTTKRPSPAELRRNNAERAEALSHFPVGRMVTVTKDDGKRVQMMLTKLPWQLGCGTWICGVHGISGGYDCARVEVIKEVAA